VTEELLADMGIAESAYYRVDIRCDSYEDDFFKDNYKRHLLLISLFSLQIRDTNRQAIAHMLTQSKAFSDVSTKSQYYEAKFYDKKYQLNDADDCKARLEFRCLKSTRKDGLQPHEYKSILFGQLDELPGHYEKLKKRCNEQLYGAYLTHCKHAGKTSKGDSATEFLSHYHNTLTIFDKRQLEQFLELCGITGSRAVHRANYITGEKCDIEFFSESDLREYIAMLKHSIVAFFST
jgi:hypothetical protein